MTCHHSRTLLRLLCFPPAESAVIFITHLWVRYKTNLHNSGFSVYTFAIILKVAVIVETYWHTCVWLALHIHARSNTWLSQHTRDVHSGAFENVEVMKHRPEITGDYTQRNYRRAEGTQKVMCDKHVGQKVITNFQTWLSHGYHKHLMWTTGDGLAGVSRLIMELVAFGCRDLDCKCNTLTQGSWHVAGADLCTS